MCDSSLVTKTTAIGYPTRVLFEVLAGEQHVNAGLTSSSIMRMFDPRVDGDLPASVYDT